MNQKTREILELLMERVKEKPIAFTVTLASLSLAMTGMLLLLLTSLASAIPVPLLITTYIAVMTLVCASVVVFTVFITNDVMKKNEKIYLSTFTNRVKHGIDYSFIVSVIKFLVMQACFLGLIIWGATESSGSTEDQSVTVKEVSYLSHFITTLFLSFTSSALLFGSVLRSYIYGVGLASSESGIVKKMLNEYIAPISLFCIFNTLVTFTLLMREDVGTGLLALMNLTILQVAGLIRHSMGEKAEEKQEQESKDIAYNF